MEFTNSKRKKRMIVMLVFSFLLLIVLVCRIGWIQFVQGAELQEKAYKQQTLNRIISPKRGTIYDSTKNKILAISASVETITVNPTIIKDENKEKVAKAFSDIFELDYQTMLDKVSKKSSIETIVKKVEKEKADELRIWMKENKISNGINIDEDSKRYYPYNNLASHIIGFCGDENTGLDGIEAKYDNILKGTVGKIVVSKSATGEELPNGEESYIPSENGSDIVLTIDQNVQSITEKYLKQAVIDNECTDGGNIIIMNPKNGDIIAMATYPDYNLNTPFEPNTESLKNIWDSLPKEEKVNSQLKMWRNKAISDSYEPGSTFKLITTSIALEEGIVTTDKAGEFNCTGSITIADRIIKCWRVHNPHGSQSLRDALGNSCNPVFIALGQKIGVTKYFEYLRGYGLLEKTGVDLPGEGTSIFHKEEKMGPVELATMSFGQRFEITPLQLTSTVAAIANDGKLMKPRVVKQILNNDNNTVTDVEPVLVRQVISKETSEKMRSLMESVVVTGTAKHAGVSGYTVGGKTGTSEDGTQEKRYVASFVGVSPISSPEVVILVTLYNPVGEGGHQGGGVAAPVAGQILGEILPYLQSGTTKNGVEETKISTIVPNVRGKTVAEAIKMLENSGFKHNITVKGDKNTIIVNDQVPKPGISLYNNSIVLLYTEENDIRVPVAVPNVKGLTAANATSVLKGKDLNINIEGTGKVIIQDPIEGTLVEPGTIVNVKLNTEIKDTE